MSNTSDNEAGGPPTPQRPAPARPTNGFAITALVTSLVLAPMGIVFGHLALRQISRTGENGRGLAIGGLLVGYLFTAIGAVWLIFLLVALNSVTDSRPESSSIDTSHPSSSTVSLEPPSADGVHMEVPADGPDLRGYKRGDCLSIAGPTQISGIPSCDVQYNLGYPVYEITSTEPIEIAGSCTDDYLDTTYDRYCLVPYSP